MAEFTTEQIRNLAVLGHTGAGKSSLLEALLFQGKAITQKGRVDKGTNHADFTAQEKDHRHSLEPSFLNLDVDNHHINFIDTPGLPDFFGRALLPLPGVETVLLVINATTGIETITQRAFEAARAQGKVVLIAVNHIDGNADSLPRLLDDIQTKFGHRCLPVNLPNAALDDVIDCYLHPQPQLQGDALFHDIASARDELVDTVLEEDDDLMALYLEQGESLNPEQLHAPLEAALRMGHLVPVCFTSAETQVGIAALLECIIKLCPNPLEANPPQFLKGEGDSALPVDVTQGADDHVLAHVFRVGIDPFFGRMGVFRVHQGTINLGMKLFIGDGRKPFKVTNLFKLQGDKQLSVTSAVPGDICAVSKVDELSVGAVLHDSHDEDEFRLPALTLPQPIFGLAVSAKRRGDEQKIAEVLNKLVVEDPSLQIAKNEAEGQTILQGQGDLHLQIALEKAHDMFNVDMDTDVPAVAYRETITAAATARYRHKKQSGGSGQFGEVELTVEPLPRGAGFEFISKVVGGSVPSQYIPAVEKGIKEAMSGGALAGYPMQDVRVSLLDGKHHSVDSKEIAFVMAGKKAFLDAVHQAQAVILEPIVEMQVRVAQEHVGDITGDISANRGIICGTQALGNSKVEVEVEAPLATVDDYSTRLKSMTGGDGQFSMAFSRYDIVPESVQRELMAAAKRE
ncbi:elongation factor G [Shewanella colwelliana]|uniref:Elongation factor G n=1 Tax=Shewanella colwelliana TaxID=23 RepID=A0A1E5IWZ0_SHECO|nr:elongation factor G [Shewanella colwelliana]MDX1281462.1 elongation factor G [Shewanella colwelliana]OEG74648.1 elongation factor G [Shewanella colwelliana]GIU19936.1 elongation factor G [Shewanella colwelliana]GIU46024.1 elongation factor G [Shewanella colwelliana]